jgi:hypothetical protein
MDFVELIKEQKMSIDELLLDTGKSLENEMTPFEKNCYGMTESDIREQYMNSLTARMSGLEMVCMSILSDAQELLAMGATNDSRQYMNRAKFILSEMMEEKREVA